MAKKNNKSCVVCREKYTFCPTCSETKELEMWRNIYCSENCKNLFHAVSSYYAKTATVEEVKARLDECDLSYKDKLNENFVNAINAVYGNKNVITTNTEDKTENKETEIVDKTKTIKRK